jgi:hypothetical protein
MENSRWPLVKGMAILYVRGLLVLCPHFRAQMYGFFSQNLEYLIMPQF